MTEVLQAAYQFTVPLWFVFFLIVAIPIAVIGQMRSNELDKELYNEDWSLKECDGEQES